jgi:hypothetical protein
MFAAVALDDRWVRDYDLSPDQSLVQPHLERFYVPNGTGIPCLVMHGGLGVDHTYLYSWLDPLGDLFRMVCYDHRGNGRFGRPSLSSLT